MKRAAKGTYGYISYEKKKRGLITVIMFAIPLTIFFSALVWYGTRRNLLSIVAVLGILPAAKAAVGWIMMMLQKSADPGTVNETEKICRDLVHGYELTVTAYEGRMTMDCVVIYQGSIACLSTHGDPEKFAFMEKHISTILGQNGLTAKAKIFADPSAFLDRIRSMAAAEAKHADGGKQAGTGGRVKSRKPEESPADAAAADEETPEAFEEETAEETKITKDERILGVIKAISL